jgi:hypothetical protein
MFEDELATKRHGYPYQIASGRWVIREGSAQYRAWEFWLRAAFKQRFFPKPTMQVLGEWPPRTQDAADLIAAAKSAIHDEVGGRAVPRHPEPWDGYIPAGDDEP